MVEEVYWDNFKKDKLSSVVLHRAASEGFGGIFWKNAYYFESFCRESFDSKYKYLHYKCTLILWLLLWGTDQSTT